MIFFTEFNRIQSKIAELLYDFIKMKQNIVKHLKK